MSLQAQSWPAVPEDTAQVVRAVFKRKGSLYITIGDQIGPLFADVDFSDMYAADGKPAVSPNLLALVVIFQFMEDLSDRDAADAVRTRLDWKYALRLPLNDTGFEASVLSDFRQRLLAQDAGRRLFEQVLQRLVAMGLLRKGGKQRTDGSYVLSAARRLTRLELAIETLQAALEALAETAPDWLRSIAQPHWYERYSQNWSTFRLPKKAEEREVLAAEVAADGSYLLAQLAESPAPRRATQLAEVALLQQVWSQQFEMVNGKLQWRPVDKIPPGAERIVTPHDPEARSGMHGEHAWEGYATHWTETCDDDLPHLITDAEVVTAPTPDVRLLDGIHERLAQRDLLPKEHLVDGAYVAGHTLVDSRDKYGINLIGRMAPEVSWQARQAGGITSDQFQIDWARQEATCPQGQKAVRWYPHTSDDGQPVILIHFPKPVCATCPLRQNCTRGTQQGRTMQISIYHETILAARQRQRSAAFQKDYARRSGIEGTVSETVRNHDARRSRYIGLAKTRLQALLTAIAIDLKRAAFWLMGRLRAATRPNRLDCLRPAQLAA